MTGDSRPFSHLVRKIVLWCVVEVRVSFYIHYVHDVMMEMVVFGRKAESRELHIPTLDRMSRSGEATTNVARERESEGDQHTVPRYAL